MISNYDRVRAELGVKSKRLSKETGFDPEMLVRLCLKIVDIEDRHRIKPVFAIVKKIRAEIEDEARTSANGY